MKGRGVVLVVALVVVLAVPTAAVTGSTDDAGAVTLSPHDGPNGQYASINASGDLEVAFTALNDDAVTTAHDVFNVTNGANCAAKVWVEIDNVTAYRHDDPTDRVDSGTAAVVLAPNETLQVGLQLDTRNAVPDPGSMTVHADEAVSCSGGTSTPGSGGGGATTPTPTPTPTETPGTPDLNATVSVANGSSPLERTITVSVRNNGTAAGAFTAEPTVEGTTIGARAIQVQPGETRELSFTHRFDGPGTYEVMVGEEVVTVSVVAEVGADIRVTNLTVANDAVTAGDSTEVVATVTNRGREAGTYTAVLLDGGTVVGETPVTVPAGESREVTFTRTFEEPGDHELRVGDRSVTVTVDPAGQLRVTEVALGDERIGPGEATTVTATVENTGDSVGERTLDLTVAGVEVDGVTVSVPAGETRTVTVEHRFATPGIYPVAFGGADAGEVTVAAGNTTADRLLESSLGAAIGLPLVAGLLLAIWRRRLFRALF